MKDKIIGEVTERGNGDEKWREELSENERKIRQFSQDLGISPSPTFLTLVFFQTDNSGSFGTDLSSSLEQGKNDVD